MGSEIILLTNEKWFLFIVGKVIKTGCTKINLLLLKHSLYHEKIGGRV